MKSITTKILLLFSWSNCLYFGYHFISKNQNFDEFIEFFIQVYSFDWTKSLGFFGGMIQIAISILILIYMGLSILVLLRFFWKFLIKNDLDLDKE